VASKSSEADWVTIDPWTTVEHPQPTLADLPGTIPERGDPVELLKDAASITGKAADRGFNAALFGMGDRIGALGDAVRGWDKGEPFNYSGPLARRREEADKFHAEHPIAATAGEIAGAGASAAAIGGGAGLTLLKSGLTLPQTLLAGGAEGGLYGAAQGAGNTYTGKLPDYLVNAGYGGAMGTVLGIPGALLGYGLKAAASKAELPRALEEAATADRAGIAQLPGYGSEAMLPDAGPAMRGVAQGAVLGTGEEGAALKGALQARDEGTTARVTGALNQTLGPDPVPSGVQTGIREAQRALRPQYEAVLNNAQAIDTAPIAQHIENGIQLTRGDAQQTLRAVRGMLDVPGNPGVLDPHPRSLQATREAVSGLLDNPALDNNTRRVLTDIRQRLTEELRTKVPGIREVDAQFAELARQSEALERGAEVFDTGKQATRPSELRTEITTGAQPIGPTVEGPSAANVRLRQGARGELERIVGTNVNDLLKLEKVIGEPQDWNAQKLTALFGPERADRLVQVLDANRAFRQTYQDVVQGSQTAQRSAAQKALEPATATPVADTLWGDVKSVFRDASQERAKRIAAENRDRIAGLLTTRGPEMQQLADQLLQQGPRRASREQVINALVNSGIRVGGYPATYINR
jgi:hypothetical protein